MISVSGDTYRLRKLFSSFGGKWDRAGQCWLIPDGAEEIIRRLAQEYGCQVSLTFVPGTT